MEFVRKDISMFKANRYASSCFQAIILTGCAAFINTSSHADDNIDIYTIDGDIFSNNTITVQGLGFGSRGHFGPAEHMNFYYEDGETGDINNAQLTNSFGELVNHNNRTGSQFNILHERGAENKTYSPIFKRWGDSRTHTVRYSLSVNTEGKAEKHEYFMSSWVRLSDDFSNISNSRYNGSSLLSFQPERNSGDGLVGGGSISASAVKSPATVSVSTSSGQLTSYHQLLSDALKPGTWHRIDGWTSVKDASTGYVDEVKFWIDGVLIDSRQHDGFRQTSFPPMKAVHFVSYMKNLNDAESPFSVQTDDHYVDFTQARIELGNAATFSESTHREIQKPLFWNDSQIEFSPNLGSFKAGDSIHLYIINADGSVNEKGFPIGKPSVEAEFNSVHINFQPASSATPRDYLADSGAVFGDRGNNLRYGWSSDISSSARKRGATDVRDQRYDTLLHMYLPSKGFDASWEIELPNGDYRVHFVAGDPWYNSEAESIDIEGIPFVSGAPGSSGALENTQVITVSDGRLTLSNSNDGTAITNKPLYIDIERADQGPDITPPSSSFGFNSLADSEQIFLNWENSILDFEGAMVVISDSPIDQLPEAGSQYSAGDTIGNAHVHSVGLESQTLISNLNNDDVYYIKVLAFDSDYNYADSDQLQLTPKGSSNPEEERLMSLNAMEKIGKGHDPKVVYQIHNRFSKAYFSALTTPEVYQFNGDKLSIDDSSEWHYASEKSATIAWQTNLPSLTYVEYGEDNSFGMRTAPAERHFYTHNHYLKNLKTDTTYHYRLVATDERGHQVTSDTRTLTTSTPSNVIRIPDDVPGGAPYLLDDANVTYLLTEDISAESGVFRIRGENVTLDLGGHTVTHATRLHDSYNGKDINHNGIAVWRFNYPVSAGKFRVLNGTFKQGDAANIGGNYGGYQAIAMSDQDQLEIAGVTFDYHTAQHYAIYMNLGSGYAFSKDYDIHHNVFKDRGWHITNRHGKSGSRAVLFTGSGLAGNNDFKLHHNLIKRTRQNGLSGATSVHDNEIYVDSWSTNSFAIQPYSYPGEDAGNVTNNRIFLTGYHAIAAPWAHENLDVSSNFVHMEGINSEDRRWWESFGDQNSLNGFRITNYGAGGQVRNNLVYANNMIVGTARHGSIMRGTEFFSDYSIAGTVLTNSTIKLISEDTETTRVAPVVTQGTGNLGHLPTVYRDSTLTANLTNVSFGDNYGRGYNHHFYNVVFEKVGDDADYHTFIFDGGYSRDGHVVRDCHFVGGAAWDDVNWRRTGALSAYSVEWTLTLNTEPNAQVTIFDSEGEQVLAQTLGSDGLISVPLTQATIRPIEWTPGGGGGGVRAKDQHTKYFKTPHRIVMTNASGEVTETTVNMDAKKTINLNL